MTTEGSAGVARMSGVAVTAIVIGADLACAGEPASVTVAVKVDVPLAVGMPEMMPVAAEMERPAGRLPETIDQV